MPFWTLFTIGFEKSALMKILNFYYWWLFLNETSNFAQGYALKKRKKQGFSCAAHRKDEATTKIQT